MFHVVLSCRAIPLIEVCSRRIWLIAHQHARVVNRARGGDLLVLLGEDLRRTRRLDAAPGLACARSAGPPVEARRIDQHHVTAAVAARNDTARRATHRGPGRLDLAP